jgi:hypothetical protein
LGRGRGEGSVAPARELVAIEIAAGAARTGGVDDAEQGDRGLGQGVLVPLSTSEYRLQGADLSRTLQPARSAQAAGRSVWHMPGSGKRRAFDQEFQFDVV